MHPSRHSWIMLSVAATMVLALGCRSPRSADSVAGDNLIQFTKDPRIAKADIEAPPQRLSTATANGQPRTSLPAKNSASTTKVAASRASAKNGESDRPQAALRQSRRPNTDKSAVAKVSATKPVAKPTANTSPIRPTDLVRTKPVAGKSATRTPSRSAAVEALLAANQGKRTVPSKSTKRPATTGQAKRGAQTRVASAKQPSRTAARTQATPSGDKVPTAKSVAAKTSTARSDTAKPSSNKPRTASRKAASSTSTVAAAKQSTKTKTPSFSELPLEVRQRALKRLVANLAKKAQSTDQPQSLEQSFNAALQELPDLPPLKRKTPDVTPRRIAATSSTKAPAKKPSPAKPWRKPGFQEMEVGELVTKTNNSAGEVPTDEHLKHEKVSVASNLDPAMIASKPKPARQAKQQSQTKPDRKPTPEQRIEPPAHAETVSSVAQVSGKATQGFRMPPIGSPKPESAVSKIAVVDDSEASQTPKVAAVPQSNAPKRRSESELEVVNLEDISLSRPPISREIDRVPSKLVRDEFRVSRVQLPDPHDLSFAPAAQQIASSFTETIPSIPEPHVLEPVATASASSALDNSPGSESNQLQMPAMKSLAADAAGSFQPPPITKAESSPSPAKHAINTSAITFNPDAAGEPKRATAKEPAPKPKLAKVEMSNEGSGQPKPSSMSDQDLLRALLERLNDTTDVDDEAERNRRIIMARHLMVMLGDREGATARVEGLSKEEQEYLRHQLDALSTIVDPNGHPLVGRRFSTALPKLREATRHLAAAADSLDVRNLEFCTEIEAYGQFKAFPSREFVAGQQVILYCEIENFTAKQTRDGFATHFRGTYDVYNSDKEKVISQALPADRQLSRNYLRDYFIAYQMSLPKKLAPGKYRMRLTMEDVEAEKYGQADVAFEITD